MTDDPEQDEAVRALALAIGRETVWCTTAADVEIRGALRYGLDLAAIEQLLRAGLSPVAVAQALRLEDRGTV